MRAYGSLCRRPARGFVAPGHPRCAYHLTEEERIVVQAILEAERDVRALRMLEDPDASAEDEREPQCHQDADGTTWTELRDGVPANV